MFPSCRGSGVALRVALLSLAAILASCSANPATGALKVEVVLEAGLVSRCVRVVASDGTLRRETMAIALAGKSSPLSVGVTPDGLSQPVTVQALGYSDEGCSMLTPGEVSEAKEATFTNPPTTVTLTLRPVSNGDGGFNPDAGADAGADAGVDGGVDGGVDAGLDLDMDSYPDSVDCDDDDPDVNPGATELCGNTIDDDCNNETDCQQTSCNGMTCAGGGLCTGNVCVAQTESVCNDGLDNNMNGLIDCADPDCPVDTICSDGNPCTTGDRCVSDGGCEKVGDFACNTPPAAQCWAASGMCVPDGGATCVYTQVPGTCDDGLACTQSETCTNGMCMNGVPVACSSPPGVCFESTGTCQEPSGTCSYAPRTAGTGTCDDGDNCTTGDTCAGDGGCAGNRVTCAPPTQCQNASTTCDTSGNCIYTPRMGQACDAGTGAGTCNGSAACVPNPIFATPPSNFTESQLPDAGTAFTVSCNTTLATNGPPSITMGGCVTMPPYEIITQSNGNEPALLVRVTNLTVNMGSTLVISGTRPVIFAVTGNVQIDGTIRATNAGAPMACGNGGNGTVKGGGGGGGFGTVGAPGGDSDANSVPGDGGVLNGGPELTPVRGGCSGGNGAGPGGVGGAGGGSIQIVATGTISMSNSGIITAPGQGGTAATGNDVGGGGGGSGGAILLEAPSITFTGAPKLTANGGSGSSGADGTTDGQPGNPGSQNSANVASGTDQGSAGMGGNGGAGTTAPTTGQDDDDDGAGGGGGAVGRIRLNANTCALAGAVLSPPATSNGGTMCP